MGIENFCPKCGFKLQQNGQTGGHLNPMNITDTKGDVFGTGFTGSGNIIAKAINGNIYYFNMESVSTEQLKDIIKSSTALETSSITGNNNMNIQNLNKVTGTKQQTIQVLGELNKIEKEQGNRIQEITVEGLHISKNDLLLKELILKGIEHFYKKEYSEAMEYFDRALMIEPDNVDALNNKGGVLFKLGKYSEAIEYFDRALMIEPDNVDALNYKGLSLCDQGKYSEAIEYFDRALMIEPDNAFALNNKGSILDDSEMYDEAIEYFDRALMIEPDYADALYNKGFALYNLERYDEAIECYDRALRINHQDGDALYDKGNSLFNLERYDEAIECYDRALRINPDNVDALNNRKLAQKELEKDKEDKGFSRLRNKEVKKIKYYSSDGKPIYE